MSAKEWRPGALSFAWGNPVALVVNQMKQTFPLEIFRKKGIPSEAFLFFSFLPK